MRRGSTSNSISDSERLAFIDETWASTNMARLRGRAPMGERLRALRSRAEAERHGGADVLDGPINRIAFQAYIEQVPVSNCTLSNHSSSTSV